jgi:hypothetical protein
MLLSYSSAHVGFRRCAAFGKGFLYCSFDNLFSGITDLAPLGHATAVNVQAVQSLDTFAVLAVFGYFASLLPSINLIRHPHFGSRDDAQAICVSFVRRARDLGEVQRGLGEILGLKDFGRAPGVQQPLTCTTE